MGPGVPREHSENNLAAYVALARLRRGIVSSLDSAERSAFESLARLPPRDDSGAMPWEENRVLPVSQGIRRRTRSIEHSLPPLEDPAALSSEVRTGQSLERDVNELAGLLPSADDLSRLPRDIRIKIEEANKATRQLQARSREFRESAEARARLGNRLRPTLQRLRENSVTVRESVLNRRHDEPLAIGFRAAAQGSRIEESDITGRRHPWPYPVLDRPAADGSIHAWVTPRPEPAVLDVAAPSHDQVHVGGVAWLFPAHTVHARRCLAAVTADNCVLQATDQYHVHRVSASLDQLLKAGTPGHAALQSLLRDRSVSGNARFRRSMQRIAEPREQRETQVQLPVRAHHSTSVVSAPIVQQGDGSRLKLHTNYVIERSDLPIVDLLADSPRLVRRLAAAALEPEAGPAAERFLREALRSAGCADELALLEHSQGLPRPGTTVLALFGVDVVDRASAVMVGSGNRMRTAMQVDCDTLSPGTILDDLEQIRGHAARVVRPRAEQASRDSNSPTRRTKLADDGLRRSAHRNHAGR